MERLAKLRGHEVDSIRAEFTAEKRSKVTFDLEPAGKAVKLTVTHDYLTPGGLVAESVSNGWPAVVSALKSLLEATSG
jgi:hypothetical protein